jgi:signal transduction histidine kinase/ActR/RegA family two-component response regulator
MKTRSGREIIVSVSAARMENGGEGTTILTNIHDITARREAENQRRELETRLENARKMQAVGTLSGGIAHEFNNILGIILGNAELTMDDVPKGNPAYAFLTEIRNASLRGKEIVRRLLGIGRKREHLKTFVNLCHLVEEEESFIRALQPKSVAVKTRLPKDCRPILGDADQLQKILYHLCTNALHAMEAGGGLLEIGVKSRTLTAPLLCYDREILPGEYVRLRVTDDGIGIPPENLHRVFEPYYTTKEIDQGIGMGLAVVHGTVTRHGGGVRIRSTPGKGTSVECWFPAVQSETPVRIGENAQLSRGNETILYVDDEASILRMAKMFLERLGYVVETQSDPANALVLFETAPDRFHLVITDRKMPAMTGVEFIARIKEIKPEVKTIMCTGYGDIDPLNDTAHIGADALLLKPIDRKAFAETIRSLLDQSLSNHPSRPEGG